MLRNLDPQYELPNRKYFSKKAVPAVYSETRADVQSLVSGADFYSLTTDMWSARNMDPYMSLTFHTITLVLGDMTIHFVSYRGNGLSSEMFSIVIS